MTVAADAPAIRLAPASNIASIFSLTIRWASRSASSSALANFARRRRMTSQDSNASMAPASQGKPASDCAGKLRIANTQSVQNRDDPKYASNFKDPAARPPAFPASPLLPINQAAALAPERPPSQNSDLVFKQPHRHCERSEAIHLAAQRKNGLLRCARNDVDIVSRTTSSSRREAPEALLKSSAQVRAWGMPDARCTRGLVCILIGRTHTSNNEYTGITRHSRTQWF